MDRFAPIVSDSGFTTSILFDASVNAGVIPPGVCRADTIRQYRNNTDIYENQYHSLPNVKVVRTTGSELRCGNRESTWVCPNHPDGQARSI